MTSKEKIPAMFDLLNDMIGHPGNQMVIQQGFMKRWEKGFIFCGVGKNWYFGITGQPGHDARGR